MEELLQMHGKKLAVAGGLVLLVLVLVGEEDSPGVLGAAKESAAHVEGRVPGTAAMQSSQPSSEPADWFAPSPNSNWATPEDQEGRPGAGPQAPVIASAKPADKTFVPPGIATDWSKVIPSEPSSPPPAPDLPVR